MAALQPYHPPQGSHRPSELINKPYRCRDLSLSGTGAGSSSWVSPAICEACIPTNKRLFAVIRLRYAGGTHVANFALEDEGRLAVQADERIWVVHLGRLRRVEGEASLFWRVG